MLIAGLIIPLSMFLRWKTFFITYALEAAPYALMPIIAYITMKKGFRSKTALLLSIVTLLALATNILLFHFTDIS